MAPRVCVRYWPIAVGASAVINTTSNVYHRPDTVHMVTIASCLSAKLTICHVMAEVSRCGDFLTVIDYGSGVSVGVFASRRSRLRRLTASALSGVPSR